MLKQNKAITLIALIITIIVLLILSAVTINMVLGENGLFNKAQEANQMYNKTEALEKMQFKVAEIQMKYYSEEQRGATLQEITNYLAEDEDVEYIQLGKEIASIDVTGYSSIIAKLNAYVYDFEITDNVEVFILGEYSSEKIKITFLANGGTNLTEEAREINKGNSCGNLPIATPPEGNILIGWYTQAEGGKRVTSKTIFLEDTTLYAQYATTINNFGYKGSEQKYTTPNANLTYKIECWGAQGGDGRMG